MRIGKTMRIGKNEYRIYWTRKSGVAPVYFIPLLGVNGWMAGFSSRLLGSLCIRKERPINQSGKTKRDGKILCFIGLHKWADGECLKTKKSIFPLRVCARCKKTQEGTYDMYNGGTNWSDK